MYFVHRRDFLDKPVNEGGLALSRRVASAALGVIVVVLIWSCRNAPDAIPRRSSMLELQIERAAVAVRSIRSSIRRRGRDHQ
jgi:hypothetical protein